MVDDERQEEKKDKPKEEKEKEKEKEELKRSASISKSKKMPKMAVSSKTSVKKITSATGLSDTSSESIVMKRQNSLDKFAKVPKYQNTYRLDPKKPFKAFEVYNILETIVLREIEAFPHYNTTAAPKLIQAIAADVRNCVRQLNYDRYKICVLVYLGEKKLQGFQAVFRALWDPERDAWTTYFYQCRTYFISCTCFGLYHD